MMSKKNDDLGEFLAQKQLHIDSQNPSSTSSNLIESAIMESEQGKAGRPKKTANESTTARVVGYVLPSEKEALNKKRGLVSESKIVAELVRKYINGEIDL